jgi:hypothetical protein
MDKTIAEIKRIIKPGGTLEIWVPDAVKIAQAFLDAENGANEDFKTKDGWFRFNEKQDPCVWFSGRTFSYGDGVSATAANHWNIHLAWFSERYLKKLLHENGFTKITRMDNAECRAYDHGFINLGIKAVKANNIL